MCQLLRPGGRTGFYTILPAEGLSRSDYQRAIRLGPRAVSTRRRSHRDLLRTAGFVDIRSLDVTDTWRQTAELFVAEQDRLADSLAELVGRQTLRDRQRKLRSSLRAIDDGLLQRLLFTARRPHPGETQAQS